LARAFPLLPEEGCPAWPLCGAGWWDSITNALIVNYMDGEILPPTPTRSASHWEIRVQRGGERN